MSWRRIVRLICDRCGSVKDFDVEHVSVARGIATHHHKWERLIL